MADAAGPVAGAVPTEGLPRVDAPVHLLADLAPALWQAALVCSSGAARLRLADLPAWDQALQAGRLPAAGRNGGDAQASAALRGAITELGLCELTQGSAAMARQLLARKYKFAKREKKAVLNHLQKIREDADYDSALSAMQLDVLRDLKRISSHLASVAYPIMEAAGQLRSPLRRSKKDDSDTTLTPHLDDTSKPSTT